MCFARSTLLCIAIPALAGAATAQPFSDDFESYASGSDIVGQGPWEVWYSGGSHATISNERAASGTKSMRLEAFSDIVKRFDVSSGRWRFGVKVYVPSDATGSTRELYVILMNGYGGGGADNWSVQTRFGLDDLTIESQFGGQTTTLTPDRWIDFTAEFDLDTDDLDIYIDGVILTENALWTANAGVGGSLNLAACDLYSNGIIGAFLDDVYLEPIVSCPSADFNGDGFVDFFDYSDYVACFEGACGPGLNADFNQDGFIDFFDYSDFVFSFEGC